ncbi:MAG: ABC transporter ATP-binding protein [Halanaerobiales bacterium]
MTSLAIKAEDLKKSFGKVEALKGISFEVEEGIIFGMLGPNGAGKTTTIETIIGLNKRDGGVLKILGYDPENDSKEIKKSIGVQLQSPALFPSLTVIESIDLFANFYPEPMKLDEVLHMIGLEEKRDTMIDNLSGGQKHRLAVGLAIVSNGKIIFLDEPTTGLDPQARRSLWEVILNLKQAGKTVFLTTHYMDEAEKLCDKLLIIDSGKVIARGTPEELINENFKEKAVEFSDPGFTLDEQVEIEEMESIDKLNFDNEKNQIVLYSKHVSDAIKDILIFAESKDKEINDIILRQPSLEDVFLKLTGRGIRQ